MSRVPFSIVALALTLSFGMAAPAQAYESLDPPPGYKDCGWRDQGSGRWLAESDGGAYFWVVAHHMTCRQARRNAWSRVTYDSKGRAKLPGWKCLHLAREWEHSIVRCKKRGSKATFRYMTGA